MKQKVFFIIFKGLSTKQITQVFLERESPTLKENFISCAVNLNWTLAVASKSIRNSIETTKILLT